MLGALLWLKASWMTRRSVSNHAWWISRIARIKRKSLKISRGQRDGFQWDESLTSNLQDAGHHRAEPPDPQGKDFWLKIQPKRPPAGGAPKKFLDTHEFRKLTSHAYFLRKQRILQQIREGTKKRENRDSRKQWVQTQNCNQESRRTTPEQRALSWQIRGPGSKGPEEWVSEHCMPRPWSHVKNRVCETQAAGHPGAPQKAKAPDSD